MNAARRRKTVAARIAKAAPAVRRPLRAPGCQVCLGRLVRWDEGGPLVELDASARNPVRARLMGSGSVRPRDVPAGGQDVVLLVDPRPAHPPIVLGFLRRLGDDVSSHELEARIDGRRVEIDARDEIVLRCGEASITLRRNGRIVIHGMHVETKARGLNRIKGGSVAIN
jgi:hypothetical protein